MLSIMTSSYWRFYNFFIFHCFWITSMKVVLHFFNIIFIYLLQLFIKLTSFFLKILYLVEQSFAPNTCWTKISLHTFVWPKFHSRYLLNQNFTPYICLTKIFSKYLFNQFLFLVCHSFQSMNPTPFILPLTYILFPPTADKQHGGENLFGLIQKISIQLCF